MYRILALAVLALVPAAAFAQESGTLTRQVELKAEPFVDAGTVTTLAEKAAVKVLSRQGGWLQIEALGSRGWVRMLAVRMAAAEGLQSGDSGTRELLSVARTGRSGTAVATGVRGLDREQISNAQPNAAELKKLADFRAGLADGERFGAEARLERRSIDYPAPTAAAAGSQPGSGPQPFSSAP